MPYASSWLPLAKRKNAKGESKLRTLASSFCPLGAMVAYTVHTHVRRRSASRGSRLSRTSPPKAKIDLNPGLLDELGPNDLPLGLANSDYEDHTYSYDFPRL